MESGGPEGGAVAQIPLRAAYATTERRKIRIILTKEDIFHVGISQPAFKRSLPAQQQHTNHRLRLMRNHPNLELLLFPNELLFKTTLPKFLLKPNKGDAPFVSSDLLRFTIVCLFQITNALLFLKKLNLLI